MPNNEQNQEPSIASISRIQRICVTMLSLNSDWPGLAMRIPSEAQAILEERVATLQELIEAANAVTELAQDEQMRNFALIFNYLKESRVPSSEASWHGIGELQLDLFQQIVEHVDQVLGRMLK
jgi:hypothetical protein